MQSSKTNITLSATSIAIDGHTSRRTFFVDHGSNALSCGTSYVRELLIAREHAARLGVRVDDATAGAR